MITPEIKRLVEGNALAFATVDSSGKPHCIAVAYVKAISKKQLLITDNYLYETRKNIENVKEVSLVVWNKEWQEKCVGYELKGTANYFKEGKWHEMVKRIPENKGEPCKGAILVTVNKVKKLA